MKIRLGRPVDLEAIAPLDPLCRTEPSRSEVLAKALAAGECWLAEDRGNVLGFVLLDDSFFGNGFVPLLIVGERFRRRGVGRSLLGHAIAVCTTRKLFTSTNESNVAMRSLLKSAGFEPSGIIHNLDPGDPELVFFRRVEPKSGPGQGGSRRETGAT